MIGPISPRPERLIRQKLRGGKRDDIRRIPSEGEFASAFAASPEISPRTKFAKFVTAKLARPFRQI